MLAVDRKPIMFIEEAEAPIIEARPPLEVVDVLGDGFIGRVPNQIQIALLLGKGAREIAGDLTPSQAA